MRHDERLAYGNGEIQAARTQRSNEPPTRANRPRILWIAQSPQQKTHALQARAIARRWERMRLFYYFQAQMQPPSGLAPGEQEKARVTAPAAGKQRGKGGSGRQASMIFASSRAV